MNFDLNKTQEASEPSVTCYYDKQQNKATEKNSAGCLKFWIRGMNGGDMREIADVHVKAGRDGDTLVLTGTSTRIKIIRRTHKIEGLVIGAKQITHMTAEAYDALDGFIIEMIGKAIKEMDDQESTEEDESE